MCYLLSESREIPVNGKYLKSICRSRGNCNFCPMKNVFLSKSGCRVPRNMIEKFEQLSQWRETLRQNNITAEYLQCVQHPSNKCAGERNFQNLHRFFKQYNNLKRKIINFRERNILKVLKYLKSRNNNDVKSINNKTVVTNPNTTDSLSTRKRKQFSKTIPAMKGRRINNVPLGPLLKLLRKPLLKKIKVTKLEKAVDDINDAHRKGLPRQKSFRLRPQKQNFPWRNIQVRMQQQHRMQYLLETVKTWKRAQPNRFDTQSKKSRRFKRRYVPRIWTYDWLTKHSATQIPNIQNYVQLKLISQSKRLENTSAIPLPESCEVSFFLPFSSKRFGICEEFSDGTSNIISPETLEDYEYKVYAEGLKDTLRAKISSPPPKLKLVKRSGANAAQSQPKSKQTNSSSALQHGKKNIKTLKNLKKTAKLFLLSLGSKLSSKSNSSIFPLLASLLYNMNNMNNTSNKTFKNNFDLKKSVLPMKMSSANRLNSSQKNKEQNEVKRQKWGSILSKSSRYFKQSQGNLTSANRQ
ncbi:uncharacterized protein LOC106870499 [Octopus bimaculoides]|nr:uncharacterized protein LOC106870499 [Octopus bimaculoides]|eukprot:XP_014772096.1 PREDICTED: uncharacterized protein LOC106870499 [Octopus bimaculoides]